MASITSKGIDIDKKEILQGYGKPPPEGLIPVGETGIYLSPNVANDKPVSPFDCEQWPDSPYCGGVPWTRTPIGFDIDFGFDGCTGWVEGTPIVGFTKMPKVAAAFRLPGPCRDQMQPKNVAQLPEEIEENSLSKPPVFPDGIPADTRVIGAFVFDEFEYQFSDRIGNWTETQKMQVVSSFGKLSVPGDYTVGYPGSQPPLAQSVATAYATLTKTSSIKEVQNGITLRDFSGTSNSSFILNIHPAHKLFKDSSGRTWDLRINNMFRSPTTGDTVTNEGPSSGSHVELAVGKYGDLVEYYSTRSFHNKYSHRNRDGDGADYVFVKNCRLAAFYITDFKNEPKAPPPDYKKRDCDCMQCCGSGQAQDRRKDQDNAEILKLLRQIKKAVGVDDFPVKMPESLISKDEGFIGNLIPNAPVQEDTIPKLLTRFVRYFDEIMGQWEIPIEIKDADPLTPGDQPKGVKLHNMAEAVADLYAMTFDNYLITQQLMHLNSKTLIEQGLTKQNVVQNYYALLCLIDFFGFKYKEVDANVPLSFKAGESRFEDFIKDSEQKIKVFDLDVNDKSVVTYKDDILVLKQAAQIIKAVHFRKLDHKGDMKQQIVDLVKFASQYLGKVEGNEIDPSGNKKNDFQDWLEDAETEFSRQTGINTQNPYGRPYDQRPRLTILDVDNPTQD